jgi:hypothetical protein
MIEFENVRYPFNSNIAENFAGLIVNTLFLCHPIFRSGFKILQKFAEPNDMNQLMGYDVKGKGIQLDFRCLVQRRMDGMILQANFILIIGRRAQ